MNAKDRSRWEWRYGWDIGDLSYESSAGVEAMSRDQMDLDHIERIKREVGNGLDLLRYWQRLHGSTGPLPTPDA